LIAFTENYGLDLVGIKHNPAIATKIKKVVIKGKRLSTGVLFKDS